MMYQLALPYHREHTQQKITVQCHELLTSLQCHELFSRRLSYDGGRASSGRLLYALSCLWCNDDSLYSPGEPLPVMSSNVRRSPPRRPSDRQCGETPEEGRQTAVVMSSFMGGR
jgi:hypothetical protein